MPRGWSTYSFQQPFLSKGRLWVNLQDWIKQLMMLMLSTAQQLRCRGPQPRWRPGSRTHNRVSWLRTWWSDSAAWTAAARQSALARAPAAATPAPHARSCTLGAPKPWSEGALWVTLITILPDQCSEKPSRGSQFSLRAEHICSGVMLSVSTDCRVAPCYFVLPADHRLTSHW